MTPNDLFASSSLRDDIARAGKGDIPSTMRMGCRYVTGLAGRIDLEQARGDIRPASSAAPAAASLISYIDAVDRKVNKDGEGSIREGRTQ